ncbi:MAG TPA: DUF2934 domain-containing protein [Vicinamibacterales bacterium]|nr:DUF2934 domain-containing protein [Vicinamibacterales bacterium]
MAKKNRTSPSFSGGPSSVETPITSVVNPDAPSVHEGPVSGSSPSVETTAERGAEPGSGDERERIAARAYERYLERGGAHGRETEDWLEAEKEISGRADRNDAS